MTDAFVCLVRGDLFLWEYWEVDVVRLSWALW